MAKKITRATLDELAKEMALLSEQEQQAYLGGGSGTESNPYTLYEFLMMRGRGDQSGCWVESQGYPVYVFSGQGLSNSLEEVVVVGQQTGYFNPVVPTYLQEDPFVDLNQQSGYHTGYYTNYAPGAYLDSAGYPLHTYEVYSDGGGGSSQYNKRIIADARGAIAKFIGYNPNEREGCLMRCLNMLGYNKHISYTRSIQMVTDQGNGHAGKSTEQYQQGLDLIDSLLSQKRPVVVGIDYSPRKKEEWINEGITDHFVVIVAKETRLIDGKETEVYRYYDPITSKAPLGTHEDNYLYLKGDKLVGTYNHHPQRKHLGYTVTQVREYKKR